MSRKKQNPTCAARIFLWFIPWARGCAAFPQYSPPQRNSAATPRTRPPPPNWKDSASGCPRSWAGGHNGNSAPPTAPRAGPSSPFRTRGNPLPHRRRRYTSWLPWWKNSKTARPDFFPELVIGNFHEMPVIQPGALEILVRDLKPQRADKMQAAARGCAGAHDVARVLRDLRLYQNDVEHCFLLFLKILYHKGGKMTTRMPPLSPSFLRF